MNRNIPQDLNQELESLLALETNPNQDGVLQKEETFLDEGFLENIEGLVNNFEDNLEQIKQTISHLEQELITEYETIRDLEAKQNNARGSQGVFLDTQLAVEEQKKEMLESMLLEQRRNLDKQEAFLSNFCQIQQHLTQIVADNSQDSTNTPDTQWDNSYLEQPLLEDLEIPSTPTPEEKPQKVRKPWIIVLSCLGLLTTGAIVFYNSSFFRQQFLTAPVSVEETPQNRSVSALGYLEPQGEVIKVSAPAFVEGTRVENLLVKLGDRVKKGQVIAILDNRERLQAALEQAKTQVFVAQSRLDQVLAGSKSGDIKAQDAKFQRTSAELEGQIRVQKAAIANLEAQLSGEKLAQEAQIERIKAELNNASQDCARYESLYQDGAVSVQQRDHVCLEQQTTEKSLREARANLTRIVSTLTKQIEEAKANLERTVVTLQQQIDEDKARLNSVEEVRSVDVKVAQAELQAAKSAVQKAQADLNLAYVHAPKDGQILDIQVWPGELVKNEGIVELGQTDQMYVTAEVYETDINQIRAGQKAIIKCDGIVKDLQGTVEEIGLQIKKKDILGTDPVADTDSRIVNVKIRLNPEDSKLVSNFTNFQVHVVINTSPSPK
ncbi:ABC exporter membrane fusion protein, DevB family [Gloeothece citriformis PCC 7424]|uniref:ABC exporter membrane fusion protein, DevB family n=1 Tax=Gloeothece citriformis (strain PCC 7424) TaxID=65393 RepID=B7K7U7_GLOC7|nr:ABC exporter membrane fusion protein [Gloeothece citriformis]ACK71143.1 ABC exporter membrane fusion protein, DevB family [Gloeothece citriformis PCC 7424]